MNIKRIAKQFKYLMNIVYYETMFDECENDSTAVIYLNECLEYHMWRNSQ